MGHTEIGLIEVDGVDLAIVDGVAEASVHRDRAVGRQLAQGIDLGIFFDLLAEGHEVAKARHIASHIGCSSAVRIGSAYQRVSHAITRTIDRGDGRATQDTAVVVENLSGRQWVGVRVQRHVGHRGATNRCLGNAGVPVGHDPLRIIHNASRSANNGRAGRAQDHTELLLKLNMAKGVVRSIRIARPTCTRYEEADLVIVRRTVSKHAPYH